jgi:signal transduction histidine kinase
VSVQSLSSLIAALLCAQVACLFLWLYWRVSRRPADLLFSLLSGALAWTMGSQWAMDSSDEPERVLFWMRMAYSGLFMAIVLFLHFVPVLIRRPLHPLVLSAQYALGAVLVGLVWTEGFFRLPAGIETVEQNFAGRARGPFYPMIFGVLFVSLMAWVQMMKRLPSERETVIAPLSAHASSIFKGGLLMILTGFLLALGVTFFPDMHLPVGPHTLAITLFCLLSAVALAREIAHTERERQRLQEVVRFRNEAVRDVAHELMNPLAAIQMAITVVLRGHEEKSSRVDSITQNEMLHMAVDNCRKLMRLLNNMLDTARLEAGRDVPLRMEETDLPALIRSAMETMQAITDKHTLELHSQLTQPVVRLDADKVYQILMNLLSNAIKYSPEGGIIQVRAWGETDKILVSVSDEGIGMTPEQQTHLFQPYERMVDPERKITGTGIGLHLVKHLVEIQGGTIQVESKPGTGSVFTIGLPS